MLWCHDVLQTSSSQRLPRRLVSDGRQPLQRTRHRESYLHHQACMYACFHASASAHKQRLSCQWPCIPIPTCSACLRLACSSCCNLARPSYLPSLQTVLASTSSSTSLLAFRHVTSLLARSPAYMLTMHSWLVMLFVILQTILLSDFILLARQASVFVKHAGMCIVTLVYVSSR